MGALLLLLGYFFGSYFLDSGIAGVLIALVIWGVMNLVAYFQGDSILLAVSGARKITRDDHPRLYNVVEEMKIASGLDRMPDIYIIDDPALNAFATGRSPDKASIAVTSGLLQKLNRDELQGVIAHEMSHILHRDILYVMLAGVMLGGQRQALFDQDMDEMAQLCRTAGVEVAATVVQRRDAPVASTYIGGGKVEEIRDIMRERECRALIIDCQLSPG